MLSTERIRQAWLSVEGHRLDLNGQHGTNAGRAAGVGQSVKAMLPSPRHRSHGGIIELRRAAHEGRLVQRAVSSANAHADNTIDRKGEAQHEPQQHAGPTR